MIPSSFSSSWLARLIQGWRRVGGMSLTLSLAIHLAVLLLAGFVAISSGLLQDRVDFLPAAGTQAGSSASKRLSEQVQIKRQSSMKRSASRQKLVVETASAVYLPEAVSEPLSVGNDSGLSGLQSPIGRDIAASMGHGLLGTGRSFAASPTAWSARCSTTERLEKLRQNGGSSECELAVSRALEWMKLRQNLDGSWGVTNQGAMTGLVLLCYLGRCETPESPYYGDEVLKGITYLVELSNKNSRGLFTEDIRKHSGAYEHGIATYALGEMYALARLGSKQLPGMKEAFERGIHLIIDHQLPDGGWGYGDELCFRDEGKGDLSVTGWQYQALKSARHAGLKIQGLDQCIQRAVDYIEGTQSKDGGFGATDRDQGYNQWNLTGCGALGLQTLAKGRSASITKSMRFLREFLTAEPLDWDKNANLYCWYYYTQAFFQRGGEDWQFYNAQFLPQLLKHQTPRGDWSLERFNSSIGSTLPAGADREIYRTTLCTLMLEVYFRYLKVGDREEKSIFER